MKIALIAARARNGVIGGDNRMLWHVPEDFAHFKKTTMGHPVVMGRKTWESIGRALPGRKNVVITRRPGYIAKGADTVGSIDEALALLEGSVTVFFIGGAEIYRQILPRADEAWVTILDRDYEGDAVFPELDPAQWQDTLLSVLEPTEKRNFRVEFHFYKRR